MTDTDAPRGSAPAPTPSSARPDQRGSEDLSAIPAAARERWSELDEATGERTFREIVLSLKGESAKVLEDFKRQQRH